MKPYIVEHSNSRVELVFVQEGKIRLINWSFEYTIDVRSELEDNFKNNILPKSDWPEQITRDFDFNRHLNEDTKIYSL